MEVLDKHAPSKRNVIRGNMNKILSKAFMHRSKLKHKFNKSPSEIDKELYRKQRNYCVNLVKKERKKYYNNLYLGSTILNTTRDKITLMSTKVKPNCYNNLDMNIFKDNQNVGKRLIHYFPPNKVAQEEIL